MVFSKKQHRHPPHSHFKSNLPSEVISNSNRPQWLSLSPKQIDLVFFDLETTGGNPQNSAIIEIGAVKYSQGKEVGRFESLVNPKRHVPHIVQKITGINDEMLKAAPKIEEIFDDLIQFIGNSVLVAHGAQGDISYLVHHMREFKRTEFPNFYFCTHLLVSNFLPQVPSKKLSGLAEFFELPVLDAHSAMDDAEMTASVFWKFLDIAEKSGFKSCDDLLKIQGDVESIKKLGPGLNPSIALNIPTTPGILYLLNSQHEISYITASANIRKDLQRLTEIGLDKEMNRIIVDAAGFKFERTNNLLDSLMREKHELRRISLAIDPRKSQYRSENFLQIFIPDDMLNYAYTHPDKVPFLVPQHGEAHNDSLNEDDYVSREERGRKNHNLYVTLGEKDNETIPIKKTKEFLKILRSDKFKLSRLRNTTSEPLVRIGHLKEGIGYFFGPFVNPKKAMSEIQDVLNHIPIESPSYTMHERFTHLRVLISLLSGNIDQELINIKEFDQKSFVLNRFSKWLRRLNLLKEIKKISSLISPEHINLQPKSGLCIISNNDFKEFEIALVVRGRVCKKLRLPFEQGERLRSPRYFTRLFEKYYDEIQTPFSPIVFTDDMCSDMELFSYWLQNKRGEGEWVDFFELEGLFNTAVL